ncbi:CALM [Lepeophtheirus salmonis]|uniref:CALM n=3 Tax=Lepeophtheirus salmonis TaxID=72036 RepID=A0A7R8CGS4_LEPSM|nr:CALM [Lepeophtheirus salmonis]CAF2818501.1 CALM [Lepeophtheirus salmonis]
MYDLIVNIDLNDWQLTSEQVNEFKEVFKLFDKDEDGVLTFSELNIVMKSLGQRPKEEELLKMVRDVSEDPIYDTIEFNEFLQMMSKQQKYGLDEESIKEAFK